MRTLTSENVGAARALPLLAAMPAGMTGMRTAVRPVRPARSARWTPPPAPPVPVRRERGRLRLTRRGRVLVVLVALVLLVVGFSAGRVSSQAAGHAGVTRPATVTVHANETLWEIAARIAPSVDPRVVVAQIEQLNHLAGPQVQAGQQLVVPRAQ